MFELNPIHPLSVSEEVTLESGEVEEVTNSWGFASASAIGLIEQGPNGQAAQLITKVLADAGHPAIRTTELIAQVLAGDSQSQARLRVLQQQVAEAIQNCCEKAYGEEG